MKSIAAAEPGSPPASLLDKSDSGWEVSPVEAALHVTSRGPRQIRFGGVAGLSISVVALAAVAVIATAYLVLRCALHLANARDKLEAVRFLSGAEGTAIKGPGGPCGAPEEDSPAGVAAVLAGQEEDEEALIEEHLLKQARLYVGKMADLMRRSERLLMRLDFNLRATCVAMFLCLYLVEFSALFSLLERRERADMHVQISTISARIVFLRRSLGTAGLSPSRRRHIRFLHSLFDRLADVEPATGTLKERQRLQRIKQLLQVQGVALGQLKSGLFWLSTSLESWEETQVGVKASSAAHECADAAAGVAAVSANPEAETAARVVAVIGAIKVTASTRREQVLLDPLMSRWLREAHDESRHHGHHGIMSTERLEGIARRPLQTQRELLEALQATPLGSGREPWEHSRPADIDAQHGKALPFLYETPFSRDNMPHPGSPSCAPCALRLPKLILDGSRTVADSSGFSPASVSRSTPIAVAVAGASAAAVADEEKQTNLHATDVREVVPPRVAPQSVSQASPTAASRRPQASEPSGVSELTAVSSARVRELQATWASKATSVTSVWRHSDSASLPEALPRPLPGTLRAAASTAVYSPEAFRLSKQDDSTKAPSTSAASWVSVVDLGTLRASAASRPSPAASFPPADGVGQPSGEPRSFLSFETFGVPFSPVAEVPATPKCSPSSASAAEAWPLHTREARTSAFQGAEKFMSGPSDPRLQTSASQPLLAPSSRLLESRLSSGMANLGVRVGSFGRLPTFRAWGLPDRPASGFFPHKKPDTPSLEAIEAGFKELARLFSGTAVQQPGEARHLRQRPVAAARPAADAAASAAAVESSLTPARYGKGWFTWGSSSSRGGSALF